MQPSLNLTNVLTVTLPALPHGEARAALLEHLVQDVHRARDDQAPDNEKLVKWDKVLHVERHKQFMSKAGGVVEAQALKRLHTAVWETWSPWSEPQDQAWGWLALSGAIHAGEARLVDALLDHPHAPSSTTLSQYQWALPTKSRRGSRNPPCVTMMGHILASPVTQPGSLEARTRMMARALSAGVDPNAPINARGELAGEHAVGKPMEMLLDAGGRVGGQAARQVHAGTPLNLLHAKLSGWSEAVRRGKAPNVASDLAQAWPKLLVGVSSALGRSLTSANQVLHRDVLRQTRALGRLLGQDCLQPAPGQLSLPGVWAHTAVMQHAFQKQGDVIDGLKKVVTPAIIQSSYRLPAGWGGVAPDGLPDGVWGLILAAACRAEKKENIAAITHALPQLRAGRGAQEFWDDVVVAFDTMPLGVMAWRAMTELPRIASEDGAQAQWSSACLSLLERTTQQLLALDITANQQLSPGQLDSLEGVFLGNHRRTNNEALVAFLGEAAYVLNRRPQTGTDGSEGRWTDYVAALHLMTGFTRGPQVQKLLATATEQNWPIDRAFVLAAGQSPLAVMQLAKNESPQYKAFLLDMQWSPPAQATTPKPRF